MRFSTKLPCSAVAALTLSGCAQPEASPPSRMMVEVTTRAGPGCGPDGAARLAAMAESYTTLKRGYAGYVVMVSSDEVRTIGGPSPADRPRPAGESADHSVILMMRRSDPAYGQAIDARKTLGPQWSSIIGREFPTRCG